MNDKLVQVAIEEAPSLIELLRTAFVNKHPKEPLPTDEEVMASFESAFQSSRERDEQWLKAHPEV